MDFFKEKLFKDSIKMLKTHIYTALFGSVLTFLLMGMFAVKSIGFWALSALYLFVYASVIYQTAWKTAFRDRKNCTSFFLSLRNGAVMSVGILIFNYVLWVLYTFSWKFLSIDGELATATGMIYNVAYVLDTFMYLNFAEMSKGVVSCEAHLMIIFVPTMASILGYIAGTKGFDISEKMMPFIYEKKNTNEK